MRQNRKNWSHEEDQTIISLVRKYGTKRWTLLSQKMKQRFPEDGRSGKQCRQRWHNHLSPIINKQPWSQEEIKLVFDSHRKFGNKWTEIAQLLPGRTDNAVKNQFYSTLRKGLRRICKILGTRNSTTRIKKIKPSALSNLISNFTQLSLGDDNNEHQLYDMLFEFSNGDRYEQLKQKEVSQKYKLKMERLLEKILDSKELGRKKKTGRPITKIQPNQQIQKEQAQKAKVQQVGQQKEQEDDQFVFNIDLEDHDEELNYDFDQGNGNIEENAHEEYDERLEKPISIKRQNSMAQSVKDEEAGLSIKKRMSQNQRPAKRNIMQIENSQNFYQCFLSKSPNFSSRTIKMPTPRMHDNFQSLMFTNYDNGFKDEDGEKFCADVIDEVKYKIDSKKERERLR